MPIPCQIDRYIQILWDTFVHPETSCVGPTIRNEEGDKAYDRMKGASDVTLENTLTSIRFGYFSALI